jgi:hypothetical protein
MVQTRDAVEHRSSSRPQEPTGEEWGADVLAASGAPLASSERTIGLPTKSARSYLSRAASVIGERVARDELIAAHRADYAMPTLLNHLPAPSAVGSALNGIAAACTRRHVLFHVRKSRKARIA